MPPPNETPTQPPALGEKTGPQSTGRGVFKTAGDAISTFNELPGLDPVPEGSYKVYRQMIADPTIALARSVIMAPILSAAWSFEARDGVPDEQVKFIQEQIEPMRPFILAEALRALDYGWAGFEKVFEIREGRWRLRKLKPLLVDITEILIDEKTGRFAGFKQRDVTLPVEKCLLYTHDKEGDNHYGRPRLENARRAWAWWNQANEVAARYDRKVAGVMPVVHYPAGESYDRNGQLRPNHEIAQKLLDSIAGGKGIAIQNQFLSFVDDRDAAAPEKRQWLIELLEDKGARQPGFIERLRYLDALKFRAMLRPERVALESSKGGIGTSDTADMQDLALTDGELIHQDIVRTINWHVVDQLLAINFGEQARGSVYITPAPLQDRKKQLALRLIEKWAEQPDGREDLRLWLDFDAILDLIELPKSQEVIEAEPRDQDEDDIPDPAAEQLNRQIRQQLDELAGRNGG